MELHTDKPGMDVARQFDDLGQLFTLRQGGNDQAGLAQQVEVMHVGLVAMAMAFCHHIAINAVRQCAGHHVGALRAQAHGAAQIGIFIAALDGAVGVFPLGDERDHRVRRGRLELGAVGVGQAGDMARELYRRHLHAETDAQVRDLVFAREAGRGDLAFDAAFAEATGHQHGVEACQLGHGLARYRFGVDVVDLHACMVLHAGMAQCFVERFVAVAQVHVFAHHRDADLACWMFGLEHQIVPALEVGRWCVEAQLVADQAVQPLLVQHARHLVDRVHVPHRDHAPFGHVGKERNLGALLLWDRPVGAADQRVGLDADLAQLFGGVLGRFGFELSGRRYPRDVAQVHKSGVVGPHLQAHLAHCLQERQGLDVADRAADFDDGHIDCIRFVETRAAFDELLDFIGDVWDHLHRLAEVVAAAFLLQHAFVDLAGGEVIGPAHARFDETLVVAQVQIGFGAVLGDEHFTVLERRHGARIHVEVGIELD